MTTSANSGASDISGLVPSKRVAQRILELRGHPVMLDSDLARLYGVPTRRLNEQVRRNPTRFPADFMFQLSAAEAAALRSHIATSKTGRGGRRYAPLVFTEHGVAMLSSVLHSERAIQVNIEIVRAFIRLRQDIAENRKLDRRLDRLEKKYVRHDRQFKGVFDAIRQLMKPPQGTARRRIGFRWDDEQ